MNACKWLWVSVFQSVLLLVALIYFSYYISEYRGLSGICSSVYKYDEYMQRVSSIDDISALKKFCIINLEIEKIEAATTRENMGYLAWTSTQILGLACSSWVAWLFYARAVQKERKPLSTGSVE